VNENELISRSYVATDNKSDYFKDNVRARILLHAYTYSCISVSQRQSSYEI
jgi:hypothetical protein